MRRRATQLARRGSAGRHRPARGVGVHSHGGVPVRSNSFRLFALTSPQRFASLVRARHGEAILEVALGRLPSLLTARQGMTGRQIAAVAAVAAAACFLGIAKFDVLQVVASAALWLIFSAVLVLRSMASIGRRPRSSRADARRRRTPRVHRGGGALSRDRRRPGPGQRD